MLAGVVPRIAHVMSSIRCEDRTSNPDSVILPRSGIQSVKGSGIGFFRRIRIQSPTLAETLGEDDEEIRIFRATKIVEPGQREKQCVTIFYVATPSPFSTSFLLGKNLLYSPGHPPPWYSPFAASAAAVTSSRAPNLHQTS